MLLTLQDFEHAARRRLPAFLFAFAHSGSEQQATVRANRAAFEQWALLPRYLRDVSTIDTQINLWGHTYAAPFGIAPMGGCALFAYEADRVLAQAAEQKQLPFILSAASSVPLEAVMQHAPQSWYQAYLPGDVQIIWPLLNRLEKAGVQVLVVTIDVPVPSKRVVEQRHGFSVPLRWHPRLIWEALRHPRWLAGTVARTLLSQGIPRLPNFDGSAEGFPIISTPSPAFRQGRQRLDWSHIDWIRQHWQGRLVLKGVLHPQEARLARQMGVDGVIVSNHGGRQLDGAVAALAALPAVLEEAKGMFVGLDGSIRQGTDVIKALALGADMVFVGRPMLYAAALGQQPMVERALAVLQDELNRSLALLGCPSIAALGPEFLLLQTAVTGP